MFNWCRGQGLAEATSSEVAEDREHEKHDDDDPEQAGHLVTLVRVAGRGIGLPEATSSEVAEDREHDEHDDDDPEQVHLGVYLLCVAERVQDPSLADRL